MDRGPFFGLDCGGKHTAAVPSSGLSDQADPHRGAVRAGRHRRYRRAGRGPEAARDAGASRSSSTTAPAATASSAVTAAKSPADGYTLLMAHTGEFAVNPAVFKDMPYDLERDFTPITMVNDAPMVSDHPQRQPDQDDAGAGRRRQGQARNARRVDAGGGVDQPPDAGMDHARNRREIPARALQGRRAGERRDRGRRGSGRHRRDGLGDAAYQVRPRQGDRRHHRQRAARSTSLGRR